MLLQLILPELNSGNSSNISTKAFISCDPGFSEPYSFSYPLLLLLLSLLLSILWSSLLFFMLNPLSVSSLPNRLSVLSRSHTWRLHNAIPFNTCPDTIHVEMICVISLLRKSCHLFTLNITIELISQLLLLLSTLLLPLPLPLLLPLLLPSFFPIIFFLIWTLSPPMYFGSS